MLVSNANIKVFNLYVESPKLHNSYDVTPSQKVVPQVRREEHKSDSENLERKRGAPLILGTEPA